MRLFHLHVPPPREVDTQPIHARIELSCAKACFVRCPRSIFDTKMQPAAYCRATKTISPTYASGCSKSGRSVLYPTPFGLSNYHNPVRAACPVHAPPNNFSAHQGRSAPPLCKSLMLGRVLRTEIKEVTKLAHTHRAPLRTLP